jgi:hypothetical protein
MAGLGAGNTWSQISKLSKLVKRSLLSKGGLNVTIPLPADWLNRLTVLTGATTWPWNSLKNYRLKPYVEWFFSMFSNST